MRTIKFSLIIICLVLYLITGSVVRLALFWLEPFKLIKVLNRLKYVLMHTFRLIGGMRVRVLGKKAILKRRGLFIISTHVGYLDGVIMGSLVPGSFTTKEEIKKVPLLGKVVSIGGSIFIDRRDKSKIIEYVDQIASRLENNINMFNFPEGHASDGTKILSFFPAFFDAPLKTKSPIIPVTITYKKIDGKPIKNYKDVYCYEGCAILKHLWNLMKFKSVDISVEIFDKIETNGHVSNRIGRKAVSELCIQRLSAYKNLPISNDHPFKRKSSRAGRNSTVEK